MSKTGQHRNSFKRLDVTEFSINGEVVEGGVLLGSSQAVDLQGEADALVLDDDGDTTISAPTDDQIDIEVAGADDFQITANTFTALSGSTIKTNTIAETTSAAGVTIDGALIKDGGAVFADGASIEVDTIDEATAAAGVTADGVLLKDSVVTGDLIGEHRHSTQELTATGAITLNSGVVFLNHISTIIAATLDAPTAGDELYIINTSASGTAAHTVTVPGGVTFDGTNTIATLDAPDEALHIIAVSATRWYIVSNNGSVGLS